MYFGALLGRKEGSLTHEEGLELAKPMVAQGQLSLLQRWLAEGKLLPSEEFADVLRAAEGRAGPAAALPLYRSRAARQGSALFSGDARCR